MRLSIFEEDNIISRLSAKKDKESNALEKDSESNGQEKDRENSCSEKDSNLDKKEAESLVSTNSHTANSFSKQAPDQEFEGDVKVNGGLKGVKVKEEVQGNGGVRKEHCEVAGKEEEQSTPFTNNHQEAKQSDSVRPGNLIPPLQVPPSKQCESAETDNDITGKAPSGVMSPRSYSFFKSSLEHVPEMNLPWESMRNTTQCGCGVTFSFSVRKVSTNALYCAYSSSVSVICSSSKFKDGKYNRMSFLGHSLPEKTP